MSRAPGPPNKNPLFRRAVETILPEQIYESIDGARVLTLFQPLRNLKECQACHRTDHEVRGVLQISLGLEKLDAQILAARNRQILVALVTIVAVTVTLLIVMGHFGAPADCPRGSSSAAHRWRRFRDASPCGQ